MAYNIDEFPISGMTGHSARHTALATAVNDLDSRSTDLEQRSAIVYVTSLLDIPAGVQVGTTIVVR